MWTRYALIGVWALFLVSPASAQDWPAFRGPGTSGIAPAPASPPVTFDVTASSGVAWRTPVPGLAHSSPIVWGGRIYVTTGREAWRASRDELPSWATPLIRRTGGRDELVTNSSRFIRGYDPATGRELWRVPDEATQVKVPTPVAAGDLVIVTGGYPSGGRPIYAIRPAASPATADGEAIAWKTERGSSYTPTPLVYDGILSICSDNGILTAYEAATGERVYQQRISPSAGGFSASPVAAGGRLYLASEDGELFVVRAGRTFELLAANPLGEVTMATPAISGNLLIVRTRGHLIGIGEPASRQR
jgi:outer membrane protein assembly factor BamB